MSSRIGSILHASWLDIGPALFLSFHQPDHCRNRVSHLIDQIVSGHFHGLHRIGASRVRDAVVCLQLRQFLLERRLAFSE